MAETNEADEADEADEAKVPQPARPVTIVLLGDVMTDLVARLDGPLVPASDRQARISAEGGGAAANTASWLARQGARAILLGRIGDDAAGRTAADGLTASGVEVRVAIDAERATGTVIVLVDPSGERTMVPDPGANAALDPDDLPADVFVPGAHLHLSGYTLLRAGSRAAGLVALRRAREAGMTASVDAASVGPLQAAGADQFLAWVDGIDVLFANRDEAVCLARIGREQLAQEDDRALAEALSRHCGTTVVKLGAHGALGLTATGEFERVDAINLGSDATLDTTGAGDAFAAGFLHAWLRHAPLHAALDAGRSLAARAVTSIGARPT